MFILNNKTKLNWLYYKHFWIYLNLKKCLCIFSVLLIQAFWSEEVFGDGWRKCREHE